MNFRFLIPAAGVIVLCGCMVGPKYKQPAASVPPAYKELPETDQWKVAHPNAETLRSNWWEIFGDPQLNALEEQVAVSNQNVKTSEAHFRQARATVRYYRAAEFPTIAVSPGVQALRYSPNQPYFPSGDIAVGSAGNFFLPFDLSYEVDLWGRIRRTVAAAREEAQASAGDLATMTLSMQAELAYDYYELRSADSQKRLLDDTVKAYADLVDLTSALFNGGAAQFVVIVGEFSLHAESHGCEPQRDLRWRDPRGQARGAEHDREEDRVQAVTAAVERTCSRPGASAIALADCRELDQLVPDALGKVREPAGRRPAGEGRVSPKVLKHPHQVRLAAPVEPRYPYGWLRRTPAMADVGVEDPLEAMLVLAFADEAGQLVLKDLPLV